MTLVDLAPATDRVPRADPLERADVAARATKALDAFLAGRRPAVESIGDELVPLLDTLAEFVTAGGKRLRPAFCFWGWIGAGAEDCDEVVAAAASLELLHACALIHDDVMDGSDRRRGRPSVHRQFSALHRGAGWDADGRAFGEAAAILVGDLCLAWSDEMLRGSGLPAGALARAAPVYDAMRTELMAGQYLDVQAQVAGDASVERALRVARYKTAKYTVERPLLLGAALGDAPPALARAYSGYGIPLGEAFQLRDDLLGVFGDPAATGKPAGDDLREGKRTVLIAATLDRATPAQAALLRRHLGDPALDEATVALLREVIAGTGALDAVEVLVSELTGRALDALRAAPIAPEARDALADLALAATIRSR